MRNWGIHLKKRKMIHFSFSHFFIFPIFYTFAAVRTLLLILMAMPALCWAQTGKHVNPEDREVDMDNPTFVPMVKVSKVMHEGDSIQYVEFNNVYVYPKMEFKNAKEQAKYNRLVYNVKKVLPIAQGGQPDYH